MANKKYDSNQKKYADKLFAAYPDIAGNADEVFTKFAALDPTATQKSEQNQYLYLDWICLNVLKEKPLPQDFYKIREDLNTYMLLNRLDKFRASREGTIFYRPYVDAQISQYSISTLGEKILPYQSQIIDRKKTPETLNQERSSAEAQSIILYDGPEGRIVSPLTTEASQYWGKATKWCISATKGNNLFNTYNNEGQTPTIMFLPKGTPEKYAFNEHDKSPTRNALDRAILDKRKPRATDSPYIQSLGDFLISTMTSPDFKQDEVEKNKNLRRAFQSFVVWHPQIYDYFVSKIGESKLPDFMTIKEVAKSVEEIAEIGKLDANLDVLERIGPLILKLPDKSFKNPDQYADDFLAKYSIVREIEDLGPCQENEDINQFIMEYMNAVPKEFWDDEDFALKFIEPISPVHDASIKALPEAYDHPKLLLHLLTMADIESFPDIVGQNKFTKGWTGKIDGVPLLEVIPDSPAAINNRVIIEDIHDAKFLYQSVERAEGLDLSPIVRTMEKRYPAGFQTSEEVEIATTELPLCDFSNLIERTIQHHPEFFADVPPEYQTMPMAIVAVKHDPGSLADMAAHLFKGDVRPPELTAAFNKLPPNSIEREAVADYFKAPEVS